jgi:hypothetical protein
MEDLSRDVVEEVHCQQRLQRIGNCNDEEMRIEVFVQHGTIAEDTSYGSDFFFRRSGGY